MMTPNYTTDPKKEIWTTEEIFFLQENLGKLTMQQLSEGLGKNTRAIKLYIHRHRMTARPIIGRNMLLEILQLKYTDPECFTPTKTFYRRIEMSQKRYWSIYRGEIKMTDVEYMKFTEYFQVTLRDAFEMRQLDLDLFK